MNLDKKELLEILRKMAGYYGKPAPDLDATKIWYDALQEYTGEQVGEAMRKHIGSPKGQYMPTAANLLEFLKPRISVSDLLQQAHDPKTVTGYLVRRCVGDFDLNLNPKVAEQKARQYLESGKLHKDLQRIYAGGSTPLERERLAVLRIAGSGEDRDFLRIAPQGPKSQHNNLAGVKARLAIMDESQNG